MIIVQGYRVFLFSEGRLLDGPNILSNDQLEFNYTMLTPSTSYFLVIDAIYGSRFGYPVSLQVTTPTGAEAEPDEGDLTCCLHSQ